MRGMMRKAAMGLALLPAFCTPGLAQGGTAPEPLRVFAAGSLAGSFNVLLSGFGTPPGAGSLATYGPAGALRARLEHGESADLFASADMAQPLLLARQHQGASVVLFARNRMCAIGRRSLGLTSDTLLSRMLDPAVKLAISTPGADPGGDYAYAVFARADQVRPGATAALKGKARQLLGRPGTAPLVAGHGAIEGIFLSGTADMVLSYCSGVAALEQAVPGLASVFLPPSLDVVPAYGLVVLSGNPAAARFALYVLSGPGQKILAQHGLVPVTLADGP